MVKGNKFKISAAVFTLATVGVFSLTLSLSKNGNIRLFAEPGEGYTCYLPEGSTEIRDLIIDDYSRDGVIFKTRGTVTSIQQNEYGQYRAFIQRTNGDDGSKSSLMLSYYEDPYFPVAVGNVIDVEGAYYYNSDIAGYNTWGIPELRGYSDGVYYSATVAEESNENPVEPWELSVADLFDYFDENRSTFYRDMSRLVKLNNVMIDSFASGHVSSFDESMFGDNLLLDAEFANEDPGNIKTFSLLVSAFNTENTNDLGDFINEHSNRNAIMNLTGIISFRSNGNYCTFMILDEDDVKILSEDEAVDKVAVFIELAESATGRPMSEDELTVIPIILDLADYLEINYMNILYISDEQIGVLLGGELGSEEIAILGIFRNLLIEIQTQAYITSLEEALEIELDQNQRDAVAVVVTLTTLPEINGNIEILMGTDEEIEEIIERDLTTEESDALAVFRGLLGI